MIRSDNLEENEIRNPPGLLIFEYFERALPYHRAPLADKVIKPLKGIYGNSLDY